MKIYAGQLPYETTEDDLLDLFSKYGEVADIRIIFDPGTGRSKGFGFIKMKSNDDALKAISELDGKDINGRKIKVNEAKEDRKKKKFN